ncbi:putative hydrolase or acyltransferase (alpha/beta hydrolase superfamily) [Rubidibacter lacunae KORDI 51-2]|uniref:Putative hydrolase or acyltransferase (Alpha/beta hydrolase superfamily) n=1 Tax=Rubidibacter lacunae KORDI 51-2 TaxID=582515 RepID=U5DFX4_9CHRO|nr:alpha/beta hydrolase [Rubidibacter lacunae]ERN40157.1 putative hydrolase or acyltransferase (alpha/beta hydrolase superfamily) [Rubidibacter lacunae KORDI 51-2]
MIELPGVERLSITTSLGSMVYYTPTFAAPWMVGGDTEGADGRPTLAFLHGFGGGSSAYEWSKVYPAFADEYRVIAPDLIGWGRSHHPERNYSPDDYITTIVEFLEQVCDTPTAVVASSLTAAIVARAAIARPELFKLLILTAPAGLSDFGRDYSRNFFAQLVSTPVLDRVIYNAGVATAGGIRNFLETRQFANPERVYEEIVMAYLASAQQPNAEYAALSFVRGDLSFDLARYIGQVQIPTAIIWGRESQFTGPEIGKRLAALNPQYIRSFIELPEVGLTPQLEVPGVAIALVGRFLKELSVVTPPVSAPQ